MGILRELVHFFYQKNLVRHSKIKTFFTKYGSFQNKVYNDGRHEYLVIMSQKFSQLQNPIIYLYSESHECDVDEHDHCYCNNQVELALKMIRKEGGVVIYYSEDVRNIDGLMKEVSTQTLKPHEEVMIQTKVKLGLEEYKREYQTIGFICKDLGITSVKLISHDVMVPEVMKELKIEIIKQVSAIRFEYGYKEL